MHCCIWYMVQCILCIQILKGPKSIWRLESTTCTRFPPHEAYVTQLIGYCTINYNLIICLPFLLTVDHLLSKKKKLKFIGKNLIFFIIKDFIPIALQTLKKKRIHEIEDRLKPLYQTGNYMYYNFHRKNGSLLFQRISDSLVALSWLSYRSPGARSLWPFCPVSVVLVTGDWRK